MEIVGFLKNFYICDVGSLRLFAIAFLRSLYD